LAFAGQNITHDLCTVIIPSTWTNDKGFFYIVGAKQRSINLETKWKG